MSANPVLSIVIPAFNEAERLPRTLRELIAFLRSQTLSWEIVISDDGSTDELAAQLEKFAGERCWKIVRSEENRGKGHAVKLGMLAARGAVRIMLDADGSMPARDLPKIFAPVLEGKTPIAIGSRYLNGGRANGQPRWRRAWSQVARAVVRRALALRIVDTHCGYKAFSARAAEEIFSRLTIDGWSFDLEVLALAPRLGFGVREVSVEWKDDGRSRVRAARDLGIVLGEAVRICANLRSGAYRIPAPAPAANSRGA